MLKVTLYKLFGPKLGRIEDFDSVLRAHALRAGTLKTEVPEPEESGIGRVWEWPEGRHRKPRRVR